MSYSSQAGASCAVDDLGGSVDDPGGGKYQRFGFLQLSRHFHYDFSKDPCVICLLFFGDQSFFVVPFGQVDCTCDG